MKSVEWWVSVMAVALALTVASAYLVPWIETTLGLVSTRRATRNERMRRARQERILELAQSAEARMVARYEVLRHLLVGIMFISYAFGLVLLSSSSSPFGSLGRVVPGASTLVGSLSLLFAAICMPVGTRYLTHAATLHHELRAATASASGPGP
jgi:hypothetical protein